VRSYLQRLCSNVVVAVAATAILLVGAVAAASLLLSITLLQIQHLPGYMYFISFACL
jgi:hypothetical protein